MVVWANTVIVPKNSTMRDSAIFLIKFVWLTKLKSKNRNLTLNSQKNDKGLIKKAAINKIKWDFKGKIKYKYFLFYSY